MTRQFMFVGLLLLGGCMWAHAQTDGSGRIGQSVPMTVGQLFEKVEDNSKSLRAQKTGVAATGLGVEAAGASVFLILMLRCRSVIWVTY